MSGGTDALTRRLIHVAVRGSLCQLRRLTQCGADPWREINGITAARVAVLNGRTETLKMFLSPSTNLDALLFEVVSTSNEAMATLLLEKGASLQCVNDMGQTVLFGAAAQGSESMVELLLNGNAKRWHRDFSGRTASDWARQHGELIVAAMIESNGHQRSILRSTRGDLRRRLVPSGMTCVDLGSDNE